MKLTQVVELCGGCNGLINDNYNVLFNYNFVDFFIKELAQSGVCIEHSKSFVEFDYRRGNETINARMPISSKPEPVFVKRFHLNDGFGTSFYLKSKDNDFSKCDAYKGIVCELTVERPEICIGDIKLARNLEDILVSVCVSNSLHYFSNFLKKYIPNI